MSSSNLEPLLFPLSQYESKKRCTRLQYSCYALACLIHICSVLTLLACFVFFEINSSMLIISAIIYIWDFLRYQSYSDYIVSVLLLFLKSIVGILIATGFTVIFMQRKQKAVYPFSICSSILTLGKTCFLLVFGIQILLGVEIEGFENVQDIGVIAQISITGIESICVGACVYLGNSLRHLLEASENNLMSTSEGQTVSVFTSPMSPTSSSVEKYSLPRCTGIQTSSPVGGEVKEVRNSKQSQQQLFPGMKENNNEKVGNIEQNVDLDDAAACGGENGNEFFVNCSVRSDSSGEIIVMNSIPNRKRVTLHSVEVLAITESEITKSNVDDDELMGNYDRWHGGNFGDNAYPREDEVETRDKSSSIPKRAARMKQPRKSSTKSFSRTTIETTAH